MIAFFSSSANASNLIITEPTDIWFEYSEPTQFVAQTYMVDGFNSDPQLWLYNEQGILIISNDDYSGLQSYISIEVQAGRYRLRAGTCCWEPDVWRSGGGWNVQYELSFNGALSEQTSTTLEMLTSTTLETTTTTEESTTTSTTSSTTTTSTSTSTTTTTEVSTTTTQIPTTTSTTSASTSTTTIPVSTTMSTLVPVAPTEPPTTTTILTSTTSSSLFVFPTLAPIIQTTTTTLIPNVTSTSTIPVISTSVPIQQDQVREEISTLLEDIIQIPQSEVKKVIDNIIENGINSEEATALVTNPEILKSITSEQAAEIFKEVDVADLSKEEEAALVESLTNAPNDIKETFQETIDIFGSGFDDYVPTGSGIDVKARRALIAAGAAITTITTAPVTSNGPSGSSGGGSGGPSGDGGSDNKDRNTKRSRRK